MSYAPDKVQVTWNGMKLEGFTNLRELVDHPADQLQAAGVSPIPGRETRHGSVTIRLIKYQEGHLSDGRPCEEYNPRILQNVSFSAVLPGAIHRVSIEGKVSL